MNDDQAKECLRLLADMNRKLTFLCEDAAFQRGLIEQMQAEEAKKEAEASKGDVERFIEKQMAASTIRDTFHPQTLTHNFVQHPPYPAD